MDAMWVAVFPRGLALLYTTSTTGQLFPVLKNKTDLYSLLDCTLLSSKKISQSHLRNGSAAISSLHLSALVLPCQSLLDPQSL